MKAVVTAVVVVVVSVVVLLGTVAFAGPTPKPPPPTYNTYEAGTVTYADPGEEVSSRADCPAGQVAVSGSADITGPVNGSHGQPVEEGKAWVESINAGEVVAGVKAHVVCAKGTEAEHDGVPGSVA